MNPQESPTAMSVIPAALERHYSIGEIAEMWKLDLSTVRRMFENVPGVLKFGHTNLRGKRRYITVRVPESVLVEFHRQRCTRLQPARSPVN